MLATDTGYALAALTALGIIFIGARFLFTPAVAAAGFGVTIGHDGADTGAYLSAKGVRDIVSGLIAVILLAAQTPHILGWFELAASTIPISDAIIGLRHHHGPEATAYGVHAATAAVLMTTAALLLQMTGPGPSRHQARTRQTNLKHTAAAAGHVTPGNARAGTASARLRRVSRAGCWCWSGAGWGELVDPRGGSVASRARMPRRALVISVRCPKVPAGAVKVPTWMRSSSRRTCGQVAWQAFSAMRASSRASQHKMT